MDAKVRNVIIFLSGVAVGGVSTFFAVKKYFEDAFDKEVASMKNAYEDRLDELEDNKSSLEGELEGPETIPTETDSLTEEEKAHKELIYKLNNKPDIKDYTKFFKAKGETLNGVSETLRDAKEEVDKAEAESPSDDKPYTDEEDEEEQLEYEDYLLNGEHKKALEENRKPYAIDPSDYDLTCRNYDKIELLYYVSDDILSNDTGEELNPYETVGDVIITSGFDNNEDDSLFVRNDKLMCDYMVTKMYVPFER